MDKPEIKELGHDLSIKPDIIFKVVVTGEAGVGKTAISKKILFQTTNSQYTPTLSFELFYNSYQIEDRVLCLQLWDTCGQEVYQALSGSFYKTSACSFLVYSIDSKKSFEKLDSWLNHLKNNAAEDIQIYLIGNKTDLSKQREVTYEEGDKYRIDNNLDYFIETSVTNDSNLKELLHHTINMLYEFYINSNKTIEKNQKSRSASTVSVKLRPSTTSIKIKSTNISKIEENDSRSCNC